MIGSHLNWRMGSDIDCKGDSPVVARAKAGEIALRKHEPPYFDALILARDNIVVHMEASEYNAR